MNINEGSIEDKMNKADLKWTESKLLDILNGTDSCGILPYEARFMDNMKEKSTFSPPRDSGNHSSKARDRHTKSAFPGKISSRDLPQRQAGVGQSETNSNYEVPLSQPFSFHSADRRPVLISESNTSTENRFSTPIQQIAGPQEPRLSSSASRFSTYSRKSFPDSPDQQRQFISSRLSTFTYQEMAEGSRHTPAGMTREKGPATTYESQEMAHRCSRRNSGSMHEEHLASSRASYHGTPVHSRGSNSRGGSEEQRRATPTNKFDAINAHNYRNRMLVPLDENEIHTSKREHLVESNSSPESATAQRKGFSTPGSCTTKDSKSFSEAGLSYSEMTVHLDTRLKPGTNSEYNSSSREPSSRNLPTEESDDASDYMVPQIVFPKAYGKPKQKHVYHSPEIPRYNNNFYAYDKYFEGEY